MYIRPVLEYASPLWHSSITKHQIDHIELIQKRACRIILGSHYKSYAEALKTSAWALLSGWKAGTTPPWFRWETSEVWASHHNVTCAKEEAWQRRTSEALINLIRLNAELATGSLPFLLLLTVLIISFSLCKLCSFGHINAVVFLYMFFVVNQIFQSFDCISVLFIP